MRLLYLSCHEVLEYDEVSMFHELGHYVFSPGAYVEPNNRGDGCLRPPIPGLVYDPADLAMYHQLAQSPERDTKDHLSREFCQRFDAIIVMHLPRWVHNNWEAMRGKPVIWRTIGQCMPHQEKAMQPYRQQGLRIVRYSPREELSLEHYAGCDAMIRFAKDPVVYQGWTGERPVCVNFTQSMPQRNEACNYPLFKEVAQGIPMELYGPGNMEALRYCDVRGKIGYEEQLQVLRSSRCYFYTGTHPASYTLNFIEAWMTGIPIVAIGTHHGNAPFHRRPELGTGDGNYLYEVAALLEHGRGGLVSDDPRELRSYIISILSDESLAHSLSAEGRRLALIHFDRNNIKEQWRQFLITI